GLIYMIAAGMIAYAACTILGNLADSIASALAGLQLSERQADAISSAVVLGSVSSVIVTFVLMWSHKTFKDGFRRFFIDNESWLQRFADGGK
ncbi:hypothetical protein, partial [Sphingomonas sp. RB1R13]|uniref:hypothetical protein n=1 Tax=Sphingomonas sp. RB1R13 TaxID=3096159 RepID=UPI002FCC1F9F